jgi:hypothetical protein
MHDNIDTLGTKPLSRLCIPGSHDAGMSVCNSATAFAGSWNTVTQSKSIGGQLALGSRYFDIRPIVGGGDFYCGHYSNIGVIGSWQGARGQSIQDLILDLNNFTASNNELVILRLSHAYDTDAGNSSYPPFSPNQWSDLLARLSGINHLYHTDAPLLSDLPLDQFIGDSAAVICVIEDDGVQLGPYENSGFYPLSRFPVYNSYANSNDLGTMAADQFTKMNAEVGHGSYFVLSWTLTQSDSQAVNPLSQSIVDMATTADNSITLMVAPQCHAPAMLPNVIFIDNFTTADASVMSLALSLLA